ncbi:MAG TPA: hypothetical protein VFJ30_05715 [Phycisphaerae bacterium]|nr:hypothetical protein [Phycisphaerae bacterium]
MRNSELLAQFQRYDVVLVPDRDEPEWWAGAPSVLRTDDGTFYLAARMREGESPRGLRGYEVRILRSSDGIAFEPVCSILREDVPIPGFERPALIRDAETGLFRLYLCGPWRGGPWRIMRLDDVADPADFAPATCRPVLSAEEAGPAGVRQFKDPFILHAAGQYHMLVIGTGQVERVYHYVSDDGDAWRRTADGPAFDLGGWHNFYTRPGCLVPVGAGYLFVYEGSHTTWHDPSYNIATGLAFTLGLETFTDLTPHQPLLTSTTPGDYHTWRYSHWLWVGEELWGYAEVARPNNTNEIRLFRLRRG